VHDIKHYLTQIADGDKYDCPTRVKAAIELGTFSGLKLGGRIQLGLQVHLSFEDALQRYAKRFPPPPRDDEWNDERPKLD
jgi:hypothetical protein